MTDLFPKQRQCLRMVGHNFVRDESRCMQKWRNIVYVVSVLAVVSAQGPMINYTVYHIQKLEIATASLSICFTNILTVIKIITFLCYKWRFISIMLRLEEMYDELQETKLKEDLKKSNCNAIYVVKLYWVCLSCTASYYMITPILGYIWAHISKTEWKKELPMPMRFPFDYESFPSYHICFIYTGIASAYVVMYAAAIEGLFLSFCINLVSHFKALQHFIQTNTFLKPDAIIQRDLKSYIVYHNSILQLYEEIQDVYSPIVFAQFLITSLQAGLIIYQLVTHLDSLLEFVKNFIYISAILSQLLIYCYGAEILKTESLMVGISVQLSNWYNLKPRHRRMLCLMMLRSQRAAIIRGGFYEASLANFMVILKAALSYITIIQSMSVE